MRDDIDSTQLCEFVQYAFRESEREVILCAGAYLSRSAPAPFSLIAAWAAAKRATGMRKGEQLT